MNALNEGMDYARRIAIFFWRWVNLFLQKHFEI